MPMDVLERIDELRKEKGWSVNNLAMEAGLTQSTLNNLYVRKAEPKLSTLRSICYALDVSLSDFFNENGVDEQSMTADDFNIIKHVVKLTKKQKQALLYLLETYDSSAE